MKTIVIQLEEKEYQEVKALKKGLTWKQYILLGTHDNIKRIIKGHDKEG